MLAISWPATGVHQLALQAVPTSPSFWHRLFHGDVWINFVVPLSDVTRCKQTYLWHSYLVTWSHMVMRVHTHTAFCAMSAMISHISLPNMQTNADVLWWKYISLFISLFPTVLGVYCIVPVLMASAAVAHKLCRQRMQTLTYPHVALLWRDKAIARSNDVIVWVWNQSDNWGRRRRKEFGVFFSQMWTCVYFRRVFISVTGWCSSASHRGHKHKWWQRL